MEPEAPPTKDSQDATAQMRSLLVRVDTRLGKVIDQQEECQRRLGAVEKGREAVEAKLAAIDEDLVAKDAWIKTVQDKHNDTRHNTGTGRFVESDSLLAAMSDELKSWIPRVRLLRGGESVIQPIDGGVMMGTRSTALARLAQRDPVLYTAVAGWFQAALKGYLAQREARVDKQRMWNERLDKLTAALGGIDPVAKAALQEDQDSEGGFLTLPSIVEAMIGELVRDGSVLRGSGVTVMQMRAKQHDLPLLSSDFTVSYVTEEGIIPDGAPSDPFSQGQLVAQKQACLVTISIELIQDQIVNLMDFVMGHLLRRAGRAESVQGLEGVGLPFTGLFSVSGTVNVGGGSNALTAEEPTKLIYGGEEQETIDGGVIYAHPWIARDAINLATGSSAVFLPFAVQNGIRVQNLYGVPFFGFAGIARNRGGGTNETTAYHGNPAFIVIGDRMGTTFDVNPWSETEYKKGQVCLRLMRRHGVLIWVPGYFTKLTAVTVAA